MEKREEEFGVISTEVVGESMQCYCRAYSVYSENRNGPNTESWGHQFPESSFWTGSHSM